MATLLKQHDRYSLQFYQKERRPQRKRIALKATRKREAKQIQRKLESDFHIGRFDPWHDDPRTYDRARATPSEALSVQEAAAIFLEEKERNDRAKSTLRTYREITRLLVREVGDATMLEALKSPQIDAVVWGKGLASATRYKRYGHLRTFLRWCVDNGFLTSNPLGDVTKPKKPNKLPKAITKEELQDVCTAVRAYYEKNRQKNWVREGEAIWRIPLFWFAFYTGMRGSELGRLRWKHIDRGKHLIYIHQQKNGKEQTIPLNAKAQEILKKVRPGEGKDFVFRSPRFEEKERSARCFRERASRAFRKARKRTDVDQNLSFHSLRHGFCTLLAEAGKSAVVIKEAARHADITTSMRYVHMANERLKAELDNVFHE